MSTIFESYNNHTSALKLEAWASKQRKKFLKIDLAPVFADMIGKDYVEGKQTYAYDQSAKIVVTQDSALKILALLKEFQKGKHNFLSFELPGKGDRAISIGNESLKETLVANGTTLEAADEFVLLSIAEGEGDNAKDVIHQFTKNSFEAYTTMETDDKVIISVDPFEKFVQAFENVINQFFLGYSPDAPQGGGSDANVGRSTSTGGGFGRRSGSRSGGATESNQAKVDSFTNDSDENF